MSSHRDSTGGPFCGYSYRHTWNASVMHVMAYSDRLTTESESRSIRSGEVLDGREENCMLTRTHETRKGIHSEALHRVLYPNAHGNGIPKKNGKRVANDTWDI